MVVNCKSELGKTNGVTGVQFGALELVSWNVYA
jgi:hypothetical protein